MFFSISKFKNVDFPNHVNWGDIHIGFDNGWTVGDTKISKGYLDKGCDIFYQDGSIHVTTGNRQTLPIFIDKENFIVSNLYKTSGFFIGDVTITPDEILTSAAPEVKFIKLDLTDDEIIDSIDTTIRDNILNFITDKPFKVFLTGGVDTALITSYVLKYKLPYELVCEEHVDMDYFISYNRRNLKKFWAYNVMHHWRTPSVLLSGANGDEMLLRNPMDAFNVMKFYGEDLIEECRAVNYYHSGHFLKDKHLAEYTELEKTVYATEYDLKQSIHVRNSKDFQHWHIGNTITFTPLDNLTLNNLILNLSYPTLKTQLLDGAISKLLIERNYPSLLKFVSPKKNLNNFDSLVELYEGKISL